MRRLSGQVRLRVVCADVSLQLSTLSNEGVAIYDIVLEDDLTACFTVRQQDYLFVNRILEERGCKVSTISKNGLYHIIVSLIRRPVLVIGVAFLCALVVYLPTRILFVGVAGNSKIPTKMILERAEMCGIYFGVSREEIRSEKMKNRLLEALPELEWAGVNTYGCLALISVKEKTDAEGSDMVNLNTNIVAARDGIITQMSVLKGTPLCNTGQAVKAGEVLVSGYADYGFKLKVTGADAEISALTGRVLCVKSPSQWEERTEIVNTKHRYSILIGKKLINLRKDSGISGADCVRIYTDYYLVLPGGHPLPVGLVKEQQTYYKTETVYLEENAFNWLQNAASDYLQTTMISGEILKKNESIRFDEEVCCLYGTYQCREMIGRIRNEEILQKNE